LKVCKKCGSHAINEHLHNRIKGKYPDLCDVCYWRKKSDDEYEESQKIITTFIDYIFNILNNKEDINEICKSCEFKDTNDCHIKNRNYVNSIKCKQQIVNYLKLDPENLKQIKKNSL